MVLANGQIAHWVVSVFSAVPFLIFLTICRDKLKSNQEHNFYAVRIVICKDILTHCMVHKLGLGLNSCIRNCFLPSTHVSETVSCLLYLVSESLNDASQLCLLGND